MCGCINLAKASETYILIGPNVSVYVVSCSFITFAFNGDDVYLNSLIKANFNYVRTAKSTNSCLTDFSKHELV